MKSFLVICVSLCLAAPALGKEPKEERISHAEECCTKCRDICTNTSNCRTSEKCANKKTDEAQNACADKQVEKLKGCVNKCAKKNKVDVGDTQQCSQALN